MANTYIGLRYVPKIIGDWDNKNVYEPLSIVQNDGNSYTSKTTVPVGIDILNTDYWVHTGNYNAQIEQYRQEVLEYANQVDDLALEVSANTQDILSNTNNITDNLGIINSIRNKIEMFRNKKLLVIGDSTSDPDIKPPNWVTLLDNLLTSANIGASFNYDLAIDGITFVGHAKDSIDKINALTDTYDYIIINLGLNDCTGQLPIGYHFDTTEEPVAGVYSVLGAMEKIINTFTTKFPFAKIYGCIPPRTNFGNETYPRIATLSMYRSAIGKKYVFKGVSIVDLSMLPMYTPENPNCSDDGIHPNAIYAPNYLDFMLTQMMNYGRSEWADILNMPSFDFLSFGSANLGSDAHGRVNITGILPLNQTVDSWIMISGDVPFGYFTPYSIPCWYTDSGSGEFVQGELGTLSNIDRVSCQFFFRPKSTNKGVGTIYLNNSYVIYGISSAPGISY